MPHHELLQLLIDNMPDFICINDLESRFILTNQAVTDCLGIDYPERALGKTNYDFFAEDQARGYYDDEQRIIATGEPLIGSGENVPFSDGTEIWYSITKIP